MTDTETPTPAVSENRDGTWSVEGIDDRTYDTEHGARVAAGRLRSQHEAEANAPRERTGHITPNDHPGEKDGVQGMTPDELMEHVDNAPITARPSRRADPLGLGRNLDAVGNERR